MEQQNLDAIVNDIYSKTNRLWQATRDRLTRDHDHGFKILYAPARFNPSVLVIGLPPGGHAPSPASRRADVGSIGIAVDVGVRGNGTSITVAINARTKAG
jgi:hypothetical protein